MVFVPTDQKITPTGIDHQINHHRQPRNPNSPYSSSRNSFDHGGRLSSMKIMSLPRMPTNSGPEAFPGGVLCDRIHGFDSSNEDLFEPIPIGRGSGTGSPTSLEAPSAPGGVASGAPAPSYGSDGASHCSGGPGPGGGDMDPTRSFPLVLHAIVSESESDCIHWLPCGTRFVIADKDTFSRNVLPRYFGGRGGATTKFTSFTRRLKRWNFSRVPSGREMGAYYHDKFRRGEPALAKSITYPASRAAGGRSPGSGAGRGGGRGSGVRRPSVPKARRRASTGSMPPGDWKAMAALKSSEPAAALDSLSPTPIKASMNPVDFPSPPPENPMVDSDLKSWLTSADFIEVGGSAMSNLNDVTPSANAEPGSVASSSFVLPPPPLLSQGIMLGAGTASMPVRQVGTGTEPQAGGGGAHHAVFGKGNIGVMKPMSARPAVPMRRHSMTMPAPNVASLYMPMMASSGNVANPFDSSQLIGNPNFAMVAANNMRFASNNLAAPTTNVRPEPPQPEQTGSFQPETIGSKGQQTSGVQLENIGSNGEDSLKDPFSMSSELSFGDLKEIDPFT